MGSRDASTDKHIRRETTGVSRIDVLELLHGSREILLQYKDTEYRLRVTSNDKLILTK